MKQSLLNWLHSLKRWQRGLLITLTVIFCITFVLVISDVSEWWHWDEWMEHIKSEGVFE